MAAACFTREAQWRVAGARARSARGAERVRRALLERLAVAPADRALELGFGSGRLLAAVAARATRGFVAGIEPDEIALRHAALRCGRLVREGRARLLRGTSADLSAFGSHAFDQVYGVHVADLWDDPVPHLCEIRRVLRPGGRLLLAGARIVPAEALAVAGFRDIHTERADSLIWTSAH